MSTNEIDEIETLDAAESDDPEDRESRRFERRVRHPPEKVWRALTEPDELAQWLPDEKHAEREILEADPPRKLVYSIGDETRSWELSPIPGGCLVVLTTEAPANDAVPPISARLAA